MVHTFQPPDKPLSDTCGHPTKTTAKPCQNKAGTCPYHSQGGAKAGLTDKQRRFVEEYTVDFNATQAAIRSGYSAHTAGQIGFENLEKPEIKDAIQERLDQLAMTADEALKRLADWGRGDPSPFLRVTATGEVLLDLSTAEAQANLHLLRKVKVKETRKNDDLLEARTEIELHDAKDAVKQIARAHGVFVDHIKHSGEIKGGVLVVPESGEDEWDDLATRRQAALNRNGDGDG